LKAQNIYKKTFRNLKITTTKNAYLPKQKVAIILGYFILSKNHNEPPKVAQLAKNHPIWSP
jgi:hypothetical protein